MAVFKTDYISAFALMFFDWVLKVLLKKGCSERFVQVLRNIFKDEDSFVSCVVKVVDNINLLGVKLARTTSTTRELTGTDLQGPTCRRN